MNTYRVVLSVHLPAGVDPAEFIEETMRQAIEADALQTYDVDKDGVAFTVIDCEFTGSDHGQTR